MSSSSVAKSPTLVAELPTFVLAPEVLRRTCSRSGNWLFVIDRVQNVIETPFSIGTTGVSNQLLMVFAPVVLLKLAPIYEFGAPVCDGNTVALPWNHPVVPTGLDRF